MSKHADQDAMEALWITALKSDVHITLPTLAKAQQVRLAMYGAVRKVKSNPDLNPVLHEAATTLTITLDKDSNTLTIGKSAISEDFAAALQQNNINPAEVEGTTANQIAQSAKRMLASLKPTEEQIAQETVRPKNPFYSR